MRVELKVVRGRLWFCVGGIVCVKTYPEAQRLIMENGMPAFPIAEFGFTVAKL